jgi:RHS repeat-associated protein
VNGLKAWTMDLNDDGKTDFLLMTLASGSPVPLLTAALSQGDGSFRFYRPASEQSTGWFDFSNDPSGQNFPVNCQAGDANGDGKADLICAFVSQAQVQIGTAFSNGDGSFIIPKATEVPFSVDNIVQHTPHLVVGDVNGDALSDVMWLNTDDCSGGGCPPTLVTGISDGSGSYRLTTQTTNWGGRGENVAAVDINGDGRADLVRQGVYGHLETDYQYGEIQTAIAQPDGKFALKAQPIPQPIFVKSGSIQIPRFFYGDVNADGKADLMIVQPFDSDPTRIRSCPRSANALNLSYTHAIVTRVLSKGDGTFALPQTWNGCRDSREVDMHWVTTFWPWDQRYHQGEQNFQAADVNGDGLADFLGAYTDPSTGTIVLLDDVSPSTRSDLFNWRPADINGDGRTNLVYVATLNPGIRLYTTLWQSDGSYVLVSNDYFPDFANPDNRRWMTVELGGGTNGGPDGRIDLAYVDNYTYVDHAAVLHQGIRVYTLVSTGYGTWTPNVWNYDAWPRLDIEETWNWKPMDVNGDGLTDLVHLTSFNLNQSIQVNVLLANSGGGFTPVYAPNSFYSGFDASDTKNWKPMDVNGDGKTDLVHLSYLDTGLRITTLLSKGDGHWTMRGGNDIAGFSSLSARNWHAMDVNGDGKMDLVRLSTSSDPSKPDTSIVVSTLFSTGSGTVWVPKTLPIVLPLAHSTRMPVEWLDLQNWKTADKNGDGRTDLIHMTTTNQGTRVDTLMFVGDQGWIAEIPQTEVILTFRAPDIRFWKPYDINGDSKTDLLRVDEDNGKFFASRLVSLAPLDLLTSVSNGYGATTRITYSSSSTYLTNDSSQGCLLPAGVSLQVVSKTTISDSHFAELADTENYSYSCAHWSYRERGFLSWGSVTSSREATRSRSLSRTVDTYQVTDGCLVQQQSTQLQGDGGYAYSSTSNSFVVTGATPPYHCQVASTKHLQHDQEQIAVPYMTWYCYDAFGNVERKYEAPGETLLPTGSPVSLCEGFGKVEPVQRSGSVLMRTTLMTYHPSVGPYIVGLPAWESVFKNFISDSSQEKPYRSTFYCYDNDNGTATTSCPGTPTHGLLTAIKMVSGGNASTNPPASFFVHPRPWPQPQSTLWGIAKAHGISLQQIEDVNAWIYQQRHTWDLIYMSDSIEISTGNRGIKSTSPFVTTTYKYDSYGNRTDVIDANGNQAHTDYDPKYHIYPEHSCSAYHTSLQECMTTVWDHERGLMTSSTDVNGKTTFFSIYDPFGRLQKTIYPNSGVVHRFYNDGEDPTLPRIHEWMEDGTTGGLWTDTYLDGLGRTYRVAKKGNAPGVSFVQDTLYTDASSLISQRSHWYQLAKMGAEQPVYETFFYDGAGRLLEQRHADASSLHWTYGNDGTNTWITSFDELRHERTIFNDTFGRQSQVREKNQGQDITTSYTYDGVDELEDVTDAYGNITKYVWDMLGRQSRVIDPDRGIRVYGYYPNGNLKTQTDAKGVTLTFTYDTLNRLHTKQYPNKNMVTWNYDQPGHGAGIGRLTSISDPTGSGAHCAGGVSNAFSYDEMGRVISQKQCVKGKTYTVGFKYDRLSRLWQTIYPGQETVTNTYDKAGRLQSVTGYVNDLQYNAAGQLTKAVYSNHTETDFSYDTNRQWLCQVTFELQSSETPVTPGTTQPCEATSRPGSKQLYDALYHYYPNGLMQSSTSSTNKMNASFIYDDLNRLLTVSGDGKQSFTYDAIGNMKTNSVVGSYTYPVPVAPSHCDVQSRHPCLVQPHAVQHAGTRTYKYDANGSLEMMSDSATGKKETLRWNEDHMLASITNATGVTVMSYDASGERVAKQHGSETTYYFGTMLEYSSKAGLIKYYYAGSLLVAQKDATGTLWYHQDQLGSIRLITNQKGAVVARYDYTPFGQNMSGSGSQRNEIGYTGQRTDKENGMIYLHGRYYDPQLARFISADPVVPNGKNPQALNRYSYVYNNPISNVDPTGYQTEGSDPDEWISWEEAYYGAIYVYGNSEPPLISLEKSDEMTVGELAKAGLYPTTGEYVRVSPMGLPIQSLPSNYDFGVDMFGQLARFHHFQARGLALYSGPQIPSRYVRQLVTLSVLLSSKQTNGKELAAVAAMGVFQNTLPELLNGELAAAEELGVEPTQVGGVGFDQAINEGPIKWAVTPDGKLEIIPKFVEGEELAHTVITSGEDVIAAGEASIAGANGEYIGIEITAHSGHYLPNEASLDIAREIFKSHGIVFP